MSEVQNDWKPQMFAIIGMAVRFPGSSNSLESFWHNLVQQRECITLASPERWNTDFFTSDDKDIPGKMITSRCGFADHVFEFDHEAFGISKKEAQFMDPQQKMLLEVTKQALDDAGFKYTQSRTGVFVGIGQEEHSTVSTRDVTAIGPYSVTGATLSIAANRINFVFDFRGPSLAVDTACSSSGTAFHLACNALNAGQCDQAVVAGVNLVIDPAVMIEFSKLGVLSSSGRCRSFDASADGYVRAEGCGVVIIKPLSRAVADGDHIYAEVLGSAINSDGRGSPSLTMPCSEAQQKVFSDATKAANITPSDIFWAEAHATGTKVGDPIEANALGSVFGGKSRKAPLKLGAVKPNIGHLECASFMASLVKVALMLDRRTLLPNINYQKPNPDIKFEDLNMQVQTQLEEFDSAGKLFAISSFGFGGSNACVILQGYKPQAQIPSQPAVKLPPEIPDPLLYVLSAETPKSLETMCAQFKEILTAENSRVAETKTSAKYSLSDFAGTLLRRQVTKYACYGIGSDIGKIQFSEAKQAPKERPPLVWVFAGQGPQHHNMGRQLYTKYPVFRNSIDRCDAVFTRLSGKSLVNDYNIFSEKINPEINPQAIHSLSLTLPSLVFLQIALVDLWKSFGVIPSAVVGHSFGEMAATYCAGVVSLEQVVEVAYYRSKLLEKVDGKGAMIACGCGQTKIEEIFREENSEKPPSDIWIAAYNSSDAVTCGGTVEAVQKLAAKLTAAKIFNRILKINSAYHTPIMSPIRDEALTLFEKCLGGETRAPEIPFMSTVTKTWQVGKFPTDYMWKNIECPVYFMDAVQGIVERFGSETLFMEMTAHPVLNSYIKQTSNNCVSFWTLHREQPEVPTVLSAVATLVQSGFSVNPGAIFGTFETIPLNILPHPFIRTYSWKQSQDQQIERILPEGSYLELAGKKFPVPDSDVWNANLSVAMIPWVSDHVVQSAVVFPGAAYIEMMFEVFGKNSVKNVTVDRVMNFLGQENRAVRTIVSGENNSRVTKIYSKADAWAHNEEWVLHAQGSEDDVSASMSAPSWASSLLELATKWKANNNSITHGNVYSQKETYDRFKFLELSYGTAFQGITTLVQTSEGNSKLSDGNSTYIGNEGFAFIDMTHLKERKYRLHPAILDVAFQCILGVNKTLSTAYVPTSIGGIKWITGKGTPGKFIAVARCSVKTNPLVVQSRGPQNCVGDVFLYDETGTEIVGYVSELAATALGNSDLAQKSQRSYSVLWQPWKFPSKSMNFPTHLEIPKISDYISHDEHLSMLCAEYIKKTLEKMPAAFFSEKKPVHRQRYLAWCQATAQKFTATPTFSEQMQSEFSTEIEAVKRVGENFSVLLKDPLAAQKIIFCDDLPERLYKKSATFAPFVDHLVDIFAEIISNLGNRVVRVLEVGAGTGGLTYKLLQKLKEKKSRNGGDETIGNFNLKYIFTDVSQKFLKDAQKLLEEFPFVEYKLFNLERTCEEQNIQPHSVDIVLAFDVLHVASSISVCLKNIQRLVVPNGILLAIEPTNPSVWMNMFFGLFKEWWDFKDETTRTSHCTLTPQKWISVLTEHNFHEITVLNHVKKFSSDASDNSGNSEFVHSLVIAHNIEDVTKLAAAPLSESSAPIIFDSTTSSLKNLLEISQEKLCKNSTDPKKFIVLTEGTQPVLNNSETVGNHVEVKNPAQAEVIGFSRVLASEYPVHKVRLVDFPAGISSEEKSKWTESLTKIFSENLIHDTEISVRQNQIWVPRLHTIEISEENRNPNKYKNSEIKYKLEVGIPGQLSSLKFSQFSIGKIGNREILVRISASALNFKDVMLALGMINLPNSDGSISCGLEFSGVITSVGSDVKNFSVGDEVFGVGKNCFANYVVVSEDFVVKKPSFLTHVEAASIPITYSTCYAALISKAQMKKGDVVLVHSAAGGIGQSCIQLCNYFGAEVIATVSSEEKRRYLSEKYSVKKFSDSRDHKKWHKDVMEFTGGKGVDIVVNSLKGPAIEYGLKSLGLGGRFVEIGKVDILKNSSVGLATFLNDLSFLSVQLDIVMDKLPALMNGYLTGVGSLVEKKVIGPIVDKVFSAHNIEQAYRYMMSGQHKGKIVVTFEEFHGISHAPTNGNGILYAVTNGASGNGISHAPTNGALKTATEKSVVVHYQIFNENCLYVLSGGLGALGWQIVKWMIKEGASKFLLLSRKGELSTQQQEELNLIVASNYNVNILACNADVSKLKDVEAAYSKAQKSGLWTGTVAFQHLVMVLKDAPIAEMTWDTMEAAMLGKVNGAQNLINALPPSTTIEFAVFFSSVSSIFGNPDQANYAAANSFLDAYAFSLVQNRTVKMAKVINLTAIEDVGVLAEDYKKRQMTKLRGMYGGLTCPIFLQHFRSIFLSKDSDLQWIYGNFNWKEMIDNFPTISSKVEHLVDYRLQFSDDKDGSSTVTIESICATIARVFGIDEKSPIEISAPLTQFGLDSLLAVELSNILKKKFNIKLSQMELLGGISAEKIFAMTQQ